MQTRSVFRPDLSLEERGEHDDGSRTQWPTHDRALLTPAAHRRVRGPSYCSVSQRAGPSLARRRRDTARADLNRSRVRHNESVCRQPRSPGRSQALQEADGFRLMTGFERVEKRANIHLRGMLGTPRTLHTLWIRRVKIKRWFECARPAQSFFLAQNASLTASSSRYRTREHT